MAKIRTAHARDFARDATRSEIAHVRASLENKAFSACASSEKHLPARIRVICFAPNRKRRSIFFAANFSNEESSNGKERWRTDEVGDRGPDHQGH
jgi:hypothetical protein